MKICGIYGIFNTANGKVLVGSSKNIKSRWSVHVATASRNYHYNHHFQSAWKQYGKEAFEFRVLEECPENMLIVRENAWMEYYQSRDPDHGYNMQTANRTLLSEQSRRLIGDRHRGDKHWLYGKHHSAESNEKNRKAHLGKQPSRENVEKMRKVNMGNQYSKGRLHSEEWKEQAKRRMIGNTFAKGLPAHNRGISLSDEQKQKLSRSLKGRTAWNKGKPFSEEVRKRMSLAKKGLTLSLATREKLSAKTRLYWQRKKQTEIKEARNG